MIKEVYFDKDELIDWRREAKEEIQTMRFCPNCGKLVVLKLREHKYYQNFYACSICGEIILKKGYIKMGSGSGYGYRNFQRYNQRRRMLRE
ncbi:unnamed protein product [marine sediment metagenome]|uniref:Uncharacterized protein n=1 Tax=marine sediment metagenome TaxID=412755 RepID=X0YIP0_9ZZZZ